MNITPNIRRLSALNTDNFSIGDVIIFCPKCSWQAYEAQGMANECPDCGSNLHLSKVDQELLDLKCGDSIVADREFTCAGVFCTKTSEQEKAAEFKQMYGHPEEDSDEEVLSVCDSCFAEIKECLK